MEEIGTSPKNDKGVHTALGAWVGDPGDPMLRIIQYVASMVSEAPLRREGESHDYSVSRLIVERIHPKARRLLDAIDQDRDLRYFCELSQSQHQLVELALLPPRVQVDVLEYATQQAARDKALCDAGDESWCDASTTTVEAALYHLGWTPERITGIRTSSKKLRKPQKRTLAFHRAILDVTERYEQMTVRQLFYQLVARGLNKSESQYKRVSDAAVQLRLSGRLSYEKIVDSSRTRRPVYQHGSMSEALWSASQVYRRNRWIDQPANVEIWCEKDALSGIVHPICQEYGVTYLALRGFSSASLFYESAMDLRRIKRPTRIYYFGDHDPSGYAVSDRLEDELLEHGADVTVKRVGLLPQHLREYNLPTHPAKTTDSRYKGFVRKYGKSVIELDALPPDVLEGMVRASIEENIDRETWHKAMEVERLERETLEEFAKASREWKPGLPLRMG